MRKIIGDFGTMRRLPRIVATLVGGDDSLLKKVIRLFEEEGFRVIGAHEIAPDLLAGAGPLAGPEPAAEIAAELALAVRAVVDLGRLDIGQAAVVVGSRVIAVEAAEGTDAMLRRCAEVRAAGRVRRYPVLSGNLGDGWVSVSLYRKLSLVDEHPALKK